MKKRILVIDDERTLCMSMQEGLRDMGYDAEIALSGEDGLNRVVSFQPNLVLLDMRLPGAGGLEVLEEIKNLDRSIAVIIMTAYADTKTAVKAIKQGAFDYLNKPFDLDQLGIVIEKAFENISLKEQAYLLKEDRKKRVPRLIGEHLSMLDVRKQIKILAQNSDATVLIRGETGTGKQIVASAIHYSSSRADKPFVEINCGAIPEKLLESELFGFERNAFTGANERKKGLLELANGGSVLLDEIGDLPVGMQVKLLRFLEARSFKRIGGLKDIEVDVRIIAATNADLEAAIRERAFREDLYYRLSVVPVWVPPLRDRGKDIIMLAEHFLQEYNKKMGKSMLELSEEVKETLLCYGWPGNVRELKNLIERMVILNNNQRVDIRHLPREMLNKSMDREKQYSRSRQHGFGPGFSLERELENIEKSYIGEALESTRWNNTRAAELLGMSRYALQRRIDKYFPGNG